MDDGKINMTHGSGGEAYRSLIKEIFLPEFENQFILPMTDSAVVPAGVRVAFTTDGYVIKPLFFPGGDIGRLAISGTVNDLAVSGARPLYISVGMIIENGFEKEKLRAIVRSMAKTAKEADVLIVTGDTKVVETGGCDGIYITTSGVGVFEDNITPPRQIPMPGDAIIASGYIGSHGVAVMAARAELDFTPPIESDVRPMVAAVRAVAEVGVRINAMRDPTRGGVASVLLEWAEAAGASITLEEEKIPVRGDVASACSLLGIDPLYSANEGVVLFSVAPDDADAAVDALKNVPGCKAAAVIGRVGDDGADRGAVRVLTKYGTYRRVMPATGVLLPRIC